MKKYSKNYLTYLKGRVQLIFTEMYESDISDDDIKFAARDLNECLCYIQIYEDCADDVNIRTVSSTIAEYCEEFGVLFHPPSKHNIIDTSGSTSSKQTRTLRTMVRGQYYEYSGDVYEYLGFGELSRLHTLRKNGEDNVTRLTEDCGYIFTEVERSSYEKTINERWSEIKKNQHSLMCSSMLPKAERVYAKTIPNPDYVEDTDDDYLLLLG